jgi:hypothetical protein
MPREWTPEELAIINRTEPSWPRNRKLTDQQITEIRQRTDSLSVPWTPEELADEYDVHPGQIVRIARRKRWNHRNHEPGGEWWLERERRERREERERRAR